MREEGRADLWFRPRRYGHGASPATWQGWAVIVAFPVVCGLVALALFALVTATMLAIVAFLIFQAAALLVFTALVRRKTNREWRWRWGETGRQDVRNG